MAARRPAPLLALAWSAVLLALAVPATAPAAVDPSFRSVHVGGQTVVMDQHLDDPRFGLSAAELARSFAAPPSDDAGPLPDPVASDAAAPAGPVTSNASPVAPDTTGCPTVRLSDDTADQRSTLPRYKAIYAYPTDAPNRYATYKDLIQQGATWVTNKIAESGGRGPRWDYGTDCGPGSLDILVLPLQHEAAYYTGGATPDAAARTSNVTAEVNARLSALGLAGAGAKWNFVVWADGLGVSTLPNAQGQHYLSDIPGPSNPNNAGGLYAIMFGSGGANFFGGSRTAYTAYAVTHEVGHTLGAVNDGAPHSTLAGHCTDGYSIMCYDDGGPRGSQYTATACPSGGSAIGYDGVAFDCGGDDYLAASPTAGGWLSNHWNVFNNSFMCEATTACLGTSSALRATIVPATTSTTAGALVALTAAATEGTPPVVKYEWDTDGDGTYDRSSGTTPTASLTKTQSGTRVFGVRVTDSAGATATAATSAVTFANRAPVAALSATPSTVLPGVPTLLSASTSTDPDAGDVLRYDIDPGDGRGWLLTNSATALLPVTYAQPGTYTARVRVQDDHGGATEATTSVTVGGKSSAGTTPSASSGEDGTDTAEPGADPAAATTAAAGPSGPRVVRTTRARGRITVRVRCAGTRACRVRAAVRGGSRRVSKTASVRAGAVRTLTLAAPSAARVRLTVTDLVRSRTLLGRTLAAR